MIAKLDEVIDDAIRATEKAALDPATKARWEAELKDRMADLELFRAWWTKRHPDADDAAVRKAWCTSIEANLKVIGLTFDQLWERFRAEKSE